MGIVRGGEFSFLLLKAFEDGEFLFRVLGLGVNFL